MASVIWIKSTTGTWLPLERVNLAGVTTQGVYVIWHGGQTPRTVRVGQGAISDRLIKHRADNTIIQYRQWGALFATWAAVSAAEMGGVERYLADCLNPLVGDRHPDERPIAVNLPWAA